jgi:hypothetical protein
MNQGMRVQLGKESSACGRACRRERPASAACTSPCSTHVPAARQSLPHVPYNTQFSPNARTHPNCMHVLCCTRSLLLARPLWRPICRLGHPSARTSPVARTSPYSKHCTLRLLHTRPLQPARTSSVTCTCPCCTRISLLHSRPPSCTHVQLHACTLVARAPLLHASPLLSTYIPLLSKPSLLNAYPLLHARPMQRACPPAVHVSPAACT